MANWMQKRIDAFRDRQRQVAAARRKRKDDFNKGMDDLRLDLARLAQPIQIADAQAQWIVQRQRVELAQRAAMQDRALEQARMMQQQVVEQANLRQWWEAAWQQQAGQFNQGGIALGGIGALVNQLDVVRYGGEDMARKALDFAQQYADLVATVYRDDNGRLHNDDGPAVVLRDGSQRYFWRGHEIAHAPYLDRHHMDWRRFAYAVEARIENLFDMIELFGYERYATLAPREAPTRWRTVTLDTGAPDHPIIGLRGAVLRRVEDDRYGRRCHLTFVSMTDSTPQPDGTYKRYHKRVHPDLCPILGGSRYGDPQEATVQNAVASMFGLRGEDYHPDVET